MIIVLGADPFNKPKEKLKGPTDLELQLKRIADHFDQQSMKELVVRQPTELETHMTQVAERLETLLKRGRDLLLEEASAVKAQSRFAHLVGKRVTFCVTEMALTRESRGMPVPVMVKHEGAYVTAVEGFQIRIGDGPDVDGFWYNTNSSAWHWIVLQSE